MFTNLDLFPLSTSTKTCLKLYGFTCAEDCLKFTAKELEKILRLNLKECNSILKILAKEDYFEASDVIIQTALEHYVDFSEKIPIISLCETIDNLVGGFSIGQVIEIFGESGTGKTQLCFQLCCNVQIPKSLGGNEAQALYIDTENSFRPERLAEICNETINTLKFISNQNKLNLTYEKMLNNVKWIYCNHPNKLNSLILYHLENFLEQNLEIKLIILDSIAYQFRYGFEDKKEERTKILVELSQKIKYLAYKYDVCIIITNQITYSLNCDETIAALDSIWGHTAAIQLKLSKFKDNVKYAEIKKGNIQQECKAFYMITKSGLVGVDLENQQELINWWESNKQETQQMSQFFSQIYHKN